MRAHGLIGLALWFAIATVPAAELEGIHFDDKTIVGGQELTLNGVGERSVAVFKGYVAALYVPHASTNESEIMSAPGNKRLEMVMLLATTARTFVDATEGGLEKNLGPDEIRQMQDRIAAFDAAIRDIGVVHPKDRVDIDYIEGVGTQLRFNGRLIDRPVPGSDFISALLRIFIGERPVDRRLKAGLLNGRSDEHPAGSNERRP